MAQEKKNYTKAGKTRILIEDRSIEPEVINSIISSDTNRSKMLEKQISHLSSRIEEELKINANHSLRIRGLQQDIDVQNKQLRDIRQSFSFKIAFALSTPYRHLSSLLHPLSRKQSSVAHFFGLIQAIIRHPLLLYQNLNRSNLITLSIAIRSRESLTDIAKNLHTLLDSSFSTKLNISKDRGHERTQIHIDHCFIFQQNVEIQGWIVSDIKVKRISVSISGKIIGYLKTGYLRPNVAANYRNYRYSRNTGFQFHGHFETANTKEEVLISIIYEGGEFMEHLIPCQVQTLETQYATYIEVKKPISHNRVKARPFFSIFILNKDDNLAYLERAVKSIEYQSYEQWELHILNSSKSLEVESFLQAQRKGIRVYDTRDKNAYQTLNEIMPSTQGSHSLFLKDKTILASECLLEISGSLDRSFIESPTGQIIFFDEDEIDHHFQRMCPRFKPGFNPDFLTSFNYIGNTFAVANSCGNRLNWFDIELESDCFYDMLLRAADAKYHFLHIPKVLIHNFNAPVKSNATISNGYRALKQHLVRNNIQGEILPGLTDSTFRLKRTIIKEKKVSIVIPFTDQPALLKTCVHSILRKTKYPNFEILLISNNSKNQETLDYLHSIVEEYTFIMFYEFNVPFNYSRINNWATKKCTGEYILFLNNDISVINNNWLSSMVEHIQRKEVGAVGAKLLYPDETVQHAGVVLNLSGLADHVNKNIYDWEDGYMHRANSIQNFTACTAACLLVKKELFNSLDGFDEINLKISFNDVDLCVKIREAGYLIVYTPFAKLYHYESKSRGIDDSIKKQKRTAREVKFFRRKWKNILRKGDEYYNPNLTLKRKDSSLNI